MTKLTLGNVRFIATGHDHRISDFVRPANKTKFGDYDNNIITPDHCLVTINGHFQVMRRDRLARVHPQLHAELSHSEAHEAAVRKALAETHRKLRQHARQQARQREKQMQEQLTEIVTKAADHMLDTLITRAGNISSSDE